MYSKTLSVILVLLRSNSTILSLIFISCSTDLSLKSTILMHETFKKGDDSKMFTTKNPLSLKSDSFILVTTSSSFSGKIPLGLSGKKEAKIFLGIGKSPTKAFLDAELSIQILINSISSLLGWVLDFGGIW